MTDRPQPVHTPELCTFPDGPRCMCNRSLQQMVDARIQDIERIAGELRHANATLDKIATVINRPEMPGTGQSHVEAVVTIADELEEQQAKVAELKADSREANELLVSCREERDRMAAHLRQIVAEHQPIMVAASHHAAHNALFETRCRRCQTDEHHTWANDNYMPWPCPTVRGLVAVCLPVEREVATDDE